MVKDNEGVLFKNEKKRDGKQDADYAGQITIEGKDYWLNAWLNTSQKDGKKYMGLRAKLKNGKQESPVQHSEIPF